MPKPGLFQRLRDLFFGSQSSQAFEDIEDLLIEADFGYRTASSLANTLREAAKEGRWTTKEQLLTGLKALLRPQIRTARLPWDSEKLNVLLILGVNGVGKTTSVAKLALWWQKENRGEVILAAGDTFRAAAAEQLQRHGERLGVRVVAQMAGADPGAVIFDALQSAQAQKKSLVLADTAGRLHNKSHLVKELQKIDKIVRDQLNGGTYHKLLVIDSTTGQNAFQQAQTFHESVGVDALILSKYDSSGKGGIAVPICQELGLPFAFWGTGEGLDDFEPFDTEIFLNNLLDPL